MFAEFTALALKHKAVNLGQGFPTLPVADFILDAIHGATKDGESLLHQYSRSQGHPRLMNGTGSSSITLHTIIIYPKSLFKALANFYSPQLAGRKLDPMTNIISAAGASEAIYSTIQAFINPGDQVIMMQPFYDCYPAAVTLAGGESVFVSLKPKKSLDSSASSHDWKLDLEELRSKIVRGKTKMIMINK